MPRTRADAVVGINVPVLESIFGRIRELIRSERGIAVPTALLVLVVSFGFATVALVSSTNSQSGSVRDQDTKTAISSADAGAEEALLRENKVETQSGTACVVSSAGVLTPGVPAADGWCPQHQGDVGTASFAYRVKPFELVTIAGQERRAVTVVSQGASDQVSRRIAISATAPTGIGVFGDNRAVGVDGVTIGGSSDVNTSTGSEQDVIIEENGTLCGHARHGPGAEVGLANNGQQCAGYTVNEGSQPTPPIDISEIYANNTNYRLLPTGADQRSGSVSLGSRIPHTEPERQRLAHPRRHQLPALPPRHVRLEQPDHGGRDDGEDLLRQSRELRHGRRRRADQGDRDLAHHEHRV